jgi:predicted RNA-binding Zn ribbon-like protein
VEPAPAAALAAPAPPAARPADRPLPHGWAVELQQQIDDVSRGEAARRLVGDVDEVAVLRDDLVGTPEQVVARIVGTAGNRAEQAAWDALQEELRNLRAASRAVRELINTLAAPAVAETSVPAEALFGIAVHAGRAGASYRRRPPRVVALLNATIGSGAEPVQALIG